MYAVVNTGGKQYKVKTGDILRVEKIPGDVSSPVTFDKVLMVADGEEVSVGQPVLENTSVKGTIVEQGKALLYIEMYCQVNQILGPYLLYLLQIILLESFYRPIALHLTR